MTSVVPPALDPSVDAPVESAVARLAEEFSEKLRPQLIVRIVRESRRDLGGSPVGAMPELVERLAGFRLQEAIACPGVASSGTASVPSVMGMGGAGGREGARRRRIVAWVVVIALVLGG